MAVKTYRDRALALFGITEPEVYVPRGIGTTC